MAKYRLNKTGAEIDYLLDKCEGLTDRRDSTVFYFDRDTTLSDVKYSIQANNIKVFNINGQETTSAVINGEYDNVTFLNGYFPDSFGNNDVNILTVSQTHTFFIFRLGSVYPFDFMIDSYLNIINGTLGHLFFQVDRGITWISNSTNDTPQFRRVNAIDYFKMLTIKSSTNSSYNSYITSLDTGLVLAGGSLSQFEHTIRDNGSLDSDLRNALQFKGHRDNQDYRINIGNRTNWYSLKLPLLGSISTPETIAVTSLIASEYSTSSTYAVGDIVTYKGVLYRCTTAVQTAGNFNPNNWTVTSVNNVYAKLGDLATKSDATNMLNGTGTNAVRQKMANATVTFTSTMNPNAVALDGTLDDEPLPTGATGNQSAALNKNTMAIGTNSFACGNKTIAKAESSHAEGYQSVALGEAGHAEGDKTTAYGMQSHSEGASTIARGNYSHAEGVNTDAVAEASHAGGMGTKTSVYAQTVFGSYNADDANSRFIVGYGSSDSDRKNAFAVMVDGSIKIPNFTRSNPSDPNSALVQDGYRRLVCIDGALYIANDSPINS